MILIMNITTVAGLMQNVHQQNVNQLVGQNPILDLQILRFYLIMIQITIKNRRKRLV